MLVAGHRGVRVGAPENTMEAFLIAAKAGVDMIETDVRMSKDGELVLIHDRSALRTTGIDKNIDEMTLSEIRSLDAGCTFKNFSFILKPRFFQGFFYTFNCYPVSVFPTNKECFFPKPF